MITPYVFFVTLYQTTNFWTKLKALADDKINVAQMMISVFDRVESMVGNGENACYQHIILLFPPCFEKPSFIGSLKVGIEW